MTKNNIKEQSRVQDLKVTLEGDLMENGAIEYKILFEIIDGVATSVDRFSKISNYSQPIDYCLKPPKEKCFEIILQASELVGATVPLIPNASSIKDLMVLLIEYMKIKKSLKGEELTKEKIQTNESGNTVIKNINGDVTYIDQRKVVNKNIIVAAADDIPLNKKIDTIANALEKSTKADKLLLGGIEEEPFSILKKEVPYFKYTETIQEQPNSAAGYVRQINDKTFKGILTTEEGGREQAVNFEIDIKDIKTLDETIRSLAIAEGTKQRVVLIGERQIDGSGKLKKFIANEAKIPDKPFDF